MDSALNILYLAHRLPYPPDKGDKIRSFHALRYLAERHRVWCGCFVDDPADLGHIESLRPYCHELAAIPMSRRWALARGLIHFAGGATVTEGYLSDARMRRTVERWSREAGFDAVLVFSSGMAPYGVAVPAARRVLDLCDLDSHKWADIARSAAPGLSQFYATEASRLAVREYQWIAAYDATTVVSAAEAGDLADLPAALRSGVHVVGNGVSLRPYAPPPGRPDAGFIGQMNYPPNVDAVCWFVEQVWPAVRREVPGAWFHIIGRRPTRPVRALARCAGVRVVGEVPDVAAHLDALSVVVAPLRIARGVPNKVLEAMAAGRPVVLTSAAARGVPAADGTDYTIADAPGEMAAAVVRLLRSPEMARGIGESGRRMVERSHRWDAQLHTLDALLRPAPQHVPSVRPSLAPLVA